MKSDPKEEIETKLTELKILDKAIYLPEAIGRPDDFHLVKEIAHELLKEGVLKGMLIGKKGWFLPDANKKLSELWSELEMGSINLETVADAWGINEKRVFLALEDYAKAKSHSIPVFHRDGMELYLISYFQQKWYDSLAFMDDLEPTTLEQLLTNTSISGNGKRIFEELVREWIAEESSEFALGNDGIIRPKTGIPGNIVTYVNEAWEREVSQITYDELSEKFGLSTSEVGSMLQKMIDNKDIEGVTLWATDELLKPQL